MRSHPPGRPLSLGRSAAHKSESATLTFARFPLNFSRNLVVGLCCFQSWWLVRQLF